MPSAKAETDQMGRSIELPNPPSRIVSLVPSQTELLANLELQNQVVGITKFCVHPKSWHNTKTRIGGTKNLNIDKIIALKPDLIIGNKEENQKDQIEELSAHFPVWMSDIKTIKDAMDMIHSIGKITQKSGKAFALINQIQKEFSKLQPSTSNSTVAYLIWNNPLMAASGNPFIGELLRSCGFTNCFENSEVPYPEICIDELRDYQPNFIFLSSEPFPFKDKHLKEFRARYTHSKVVLVDGEMFSWYGSRLLYAPSYFQKLLNTI